MRLRRLNLTRYGHFTNYSIDFGNLEEGKPDLHVIFGPNEAGKSTAFEGYLDLLFGIPVRSSYNFLHDYDNMLVGGVLEIDGVLVELARIKKNRNDLLDNQGNPANPAMLHHVLAGMTREQYRAMFSLNDETIEAGGEDILESQGDLGELLFAASAGLSELGNVLDQVRMDIHEFHKPRAQKTILSDAKRNIKHIDSEIIKLDTNASTFRTLVKAEKDARNKYEAVKVERDRLIKEKALVEATLECLPLLPRLALIHDELSELKEFQDIPDSLVNEIEELKSRSEQLQRDKHEALEDCSKLSEKRDRLKRDPALLAIKDELELLLDISKSRAQTALADLPDRYLELEILNAKIDRGFEQLNYGDKEPEQVAEPLLGQMENLANDWIAKEHELNNAVKEKRATQHKLKELSENNKVTEAKIKVDTDIGQLLERIKPEDLVSKLESCEKAVQAAIDKINAGIMDLFPWTGEIDKLPKHEFAEDQVKRLVERWVSLNNDLNKAQEAFDEATLYANQRSARITEAENDQSFISDKEAKAIQTKRDALWLNHFSHMNPETAEAFHQAMIYCDTVHDARLATADRLARLREMQSDKAAYEATREHFQHKIADLQQKIDAEREIIATHLKALCLPESFDVLELPSWLKKLSTVHADVETLSKESETLTLVKQAVAYAEQTLRDALAVGVGLTLSELTHLARKCVTVVTLIKTISTDLQEREKTNELLEGDLAVIQAAWQKLAINLPVFFETPTEFRAALSTLREINGWMMQREGLVHRIHAMEKDVSAFATQIKGYAKAVEEAEDAHPLVLAKKLEERLKEAVLTESLFSELCVELEQANTKRINAEHEWITLTEKIREKARNFAASVCIETINDLIAAVEKSKRVRSLCSDCHELENRIVTRLGKPNIETAKSFLADKAIPDMQAQLESIKKDCDQAEENYEKVIGDYRSASDKLKHIGGDDAVVRLKEERQTVILTVSEQAKQNLRLRLGLIAAEQALSRYRDKHRSRMLLDTTKAFKTLTGGRYSDLQTQPAGQKEILLALREDNKRSISVADMSKGTRFQLYLALRLAGYRQFVSGGTVLPFVADDIMETFDNVRTSAALELLRQTALHGQALYFTHHEHVVELAREQCGDAVTIHHLIA